MAADYDNAQVSWKVQRAIMRLNGSEEDSEGKAICSEKILEMG